MSDHGNTDGDQYYSPYGAPQAGQWPGGAPAYGPDPRYGPDPYASDPAYGADPGYRQEPPHASSAPPLDTAYRSEPAAAQPAASGTSARGDALTALITSSVLILTCVGFLSIPAAILAGVAFSKADRDPDGSHKLLRMAWIAMAAGLWITIWLVAGYLLLSFKEAIDNASPWSGY